MFEKSESLVQMSESFDSISRFFFLGGGGVGFKRVSVLLIAVITSYQVCKCR